MYHTNAVWECKYHGGHHFRERKATTFPVMMASHFHANNPVIVRGYEHLEFVTRTPCSLPSVRYRSAVDALTRGAVTAALMPRGIGEHKVARMLFRTGENIEFIRNCADTRVSADQPSEQCGYEVPRCSGCGDCRSWCGRHWASPEEQGLHGRCTDAAILSSSVPSHHPLVKDSRPSRHA
eukprot:scaffold3734_cov425-Prasinococcus_capsulatus_cf.AAC.18